MLALVYLIPVLAVSVGAQNNTSYSSESIAAYRSVSLQLTSEGQETTMPTATQDLPLLSDLAKAIIIMLGGIVGLLVTMWAVLRFCCSENVAGCLVDKPCCLNCLRRFGAVQHEPVGITLSEEDLAWTPNGFNVTPKVENFVGERNVKVDYLFERADGERVQWKKNSYNNLPHILEGFDKTWEGYLTATASNEKIRCGCCVAQCCGYKARTWIQIKKQVSIKSLNPVWTQDGLSVAIEVEHFDNPEVVNITYSYSRGDVANIENQNESTPWTNLSYSNQPHLLRGIDNSCQGILTATASDGRYSTPPKSENIEKQVSTTFKTEWTSSGLEITPEIDNFNDYDKVKITYSCKVLSREWTKSYSDRPHILEGIDNTWQGILTATASDGTYTTQQCQHQIKREFDLQKFRENLITLYKKNLSETVLFPWRERLHKEKSMDDIYVEPQLERSARSEEEESDLWDARARQVMGARDDGTVLMADLVTLEDSKHGHEGLAKRVVLKGEVGIGKSTLLCKLAYDWATGSTAPLNKFQLVFLLQMKRLDQNMGLFEAISRQIFPFDDSKRLCNYLKQNQDKILILMDGWDETSIGNIALDAAYEGTMTIMTIEQILACRQLPQTCVIISTRPHKPLGTIQSRYITVNVKGFSDDDRKEYIRSFFSSGRNSEANEDIDKTHKEVTAELNNSPMIFTLSRIPIILMLLCTVWEDALKFPDTCDLYQRFVEVIVKRYKHAIQGGKTGIKLNDSEDFQRKLGKVALEGLLSNTNIQKDTVECSEDMFGATMCSLGLGTGILRKEWRLIRSEEESIVSFLHKSFQEFLAGKYLAKLFDSTYTEFRAKLEKLETWDLVLQKFEVLRFCCGASQSAANAVIEHVNRIFDVKYKGRNAGPAIACRADHAHRVHIESKISVGHDMAHHAADQVDCLPILSLLQECKLKDDPSLISVFKKSIFSDALSVHINCDDPRSLPIFKSFIESEIGKVTSKQVRSIFLDTIKLNVQNANLTQDILNGVSNVEHLKIEESPSFSKPPTDIPTELSNTIALIPKLGIPKLAVLSVSNGSVHGLLSQLSASTSLRHVEFTGCYIGDAITDIVTILTLPRTHHPVSCLILRDECVGLGREGLGIQLSAAFHGIPSNLKRLDLSGNAVNIASLVRILQCCPHLQVLCLSEVGLKAKDIKTLSNHLCGTLLELDLSTNYVEDSIAPLTAALLHCKKLERLSLQRTGLNKDKIKTLSELFSSTTNLIELDLGWNWIEERPGESIESLVDHLQNCHRLSMLDLQYTMGDAGIVILANRLNKLPNLTQLNLVGAKGNAGLDAVFNNIHQLPNLTRLDISFKIDNQCSDLVKNCLHAVGMVKEDGIRPIRWDLDMIRKIKAVAPN
ncbi:NLR family CARD domain-containing protein 4-like [Amphiura filiformis]|uniref:NLR family CARD domain-containing protein 4-like n=1 Tax=Amphiura filiformis TaxID=82378 RepID=UPI003B21D47C